MVKIRVYHPHSPPEALPGGFADTTFIRLDNYDPDSITFRACDSTGNPHLQGNLATLRPRGISRHVNVSPGIGIALTPGGRLQVYEDPHYSPSIFPEATPLLWSYRLWNPACTSDPTIYRLNSRNSTGTTDGVTIGITEQAGSISLGHCMLQISSRGIKRLDGFSYRDIPIDNRGHISINESH